MKNPSQQFALGYASDIYPPSFFVGFFGYLVAVAISGYQYEWNDALVAFVVGGLFAAGAYGGGYHFALIVLPWLERGVTQSVQPAQHTGYEEAETAPTVQESRIAPSPVRRELDYNPRHLSLFFKAIDAGDIQVGETVTLAKLNTANISRFDNRGGDSSAVKFLDFLRRVGLVDKEDTLLRKPPPPRQMDTPAPF